ncbi:GFA family protein [Verrucomicrobium sp. BvORR106]|uniref:GFA family protein n=1 Tax=Verrucomicrobium sp. BvORR106 TaxID=1403819 RepID=UPI00056EB901
MKDPILKFTGGCLCGKTRYEAAGSPHDITHCHCEDCRRSSGSAFVTWASFRSADFAFTSGDPKTLEWASRFRGFCPECGTPLTFQAEPGADDVAVTVASLDEPGVVIPADHTWTQDRLPWIHLDDGLPEYLTDRR